MNTHTPLAIVGFLALTVNAQLPTSIRPVMRADREQDGLRGAVKLVKTEMETDSSGGRQRERGHRIRLSQVEYDLTGHKTLDVAFDSNGNTSFRKIFSYDIDGKLIELIVYTQQTGFKHFYRRNASGDRMLENVFDSRGSLVANIRHNYDRFGRITSEQARNAKGQATMTKTVTYFEDGARKEIILGSAAASKLISLYDRSGNPMEITNYGIQDSIVDRTIFVYDADGRSLIERVVRGAQSEILSRITYAYDEKGNITKQDEFDSDGSCKQRIEYSYQFDFAGNWVQRATTVSSSCTQNTGVELRETVFREIVYY